MSIDLRQLRPGKLAGLLNSTRLGEVMSESRVRRNVVRAIWRGGKGREVNVPGYAASEAPLLHRFVQQVGVSVRIELLRSEAVRRRTIINQETKKRIERATELKDNPKSEPVTVAGWSPVGNAR